MPHKKLLDAALALPADDRAELARAIIASLDGAVDDDAEQAWAVEIRRRVRDLEQGRVKPVPWLAVEKRVKARLRRIKSR